MKMYLIKPFAMALLVVTSASVFSSCSVFGNNGDVKEPPFTLIQESGDYQVRRYTPMMLAQVTSTGKWDKASNQSFRPLFNYISGENSTRTKVAMTSPVFNEEKTQYSKKIPMTAPVFMEEKTKDSAKIWTMSFVLPADFTINNTPRPLNSKVKIVEQPAKKYAVLTYNGIADIKKRQQKAEMLQDWIRNQKLSPVSQPTYAGYNPPFTLPALSLIHI